MKKIIILSLVILFSCKDFGNPLAPDNTTSYTYSDIQNIFDDNCTQCHYQGNDYDTILYESYQDIVNSGTVVPGDAGSSSLYDRITRPESESGDMPPGPGSLTTQQIELIESWINAGALLEW